MTKLHNETEQIYWYNINQIKKYKMETKKKINWLRIWQIVRDILVGILTTDLIREKI